MEIEARVLKLERSNRVWKFASLACVSAVVMLGLSDPDDQKTVACERLVINDPYSRGRIEVGYDKKDKLLRGLTIKALGDDGETIAYASVQEDSFMCSAGAFSLAAIEDSASLRVGNVLVGTDSIAVQNGGMRDIVSIGKRSDGDGLIQIRDRNLNKAVYLGLAWDRDSEDKTRYGSIRVFDTTSTIGARIIEP
tara:strand:+ start:7693 stop:8274 length:582 start_codon:yes stop_codon:yes gene_type:complete